MFSNLTLSQKVAGVLFLASKLFGLCAVISLVFATKVPFIPIMFGSLWTMFLVLCFVFCFLDMSDKDKERELYEKLKMKYENRDGKSY